MDWYPWGEEALERAEREDKPILLSIGYAACHWCHVMERESFEDEGTAALMNEHFVSIKVDREERPDLDSIYMDAVQAMNGHGGWPLTAFLTPQGEPFYAGTYYPPEPRHGMPSFRQVLTNIAEAWSDRRSDVLTQAGHVVDSVARGGDIGGSDEPLSEDVAGQAFSTLSRGFDRRWGGFGTAPKFPQPMVLEFLLRRAVRGVPEAAPMLATTLDRMAAGGIYDHLGGGFARYSTDGAWHVPHFEKMLYDNAQLLRLYARAWQVTGDERYGRVATETAGYMLRELALPEGGFASSQDADSEGVEGKFFTWTWEELVSLVGPAVARCLGAMPGGNWEGTNVLWRPTDVAAVAAEEGRDEDELASEVEVGLRTLFEAREDRVRPATDDKVITAWNGMAASALAEAGRVLRDERYVLEATRCMDFVLENLRDPTGRLLRAWRAGVAGGRGFSDDHALAAEACLTLYETTFELRWFDEARALCDELIRLFADEERGGFFTTGIDQERLVVRPKDLYDNAVPSGNSVAAEVLQRMALLTGESAYERAGVSGLRLVRDVLGRAPTGFGHALCALDLYIGPSREVAVVGEPRSEDTRSLVSEIRSRYRPNMVLAVAAPDDPEPFERVGLMRDRVVKDGLATAYVCRSFICELPVTDPAALAAQLG